MSEQQLRVLLVDDEESLREPLAVHLRKNYGYRVDTAANGEEALRLVEESQGQYDVALIDELLFPEPNGLEVMKQIKARHPDVEAIMFTGWGLDSVLEALRAGAYRYLAKPFNLEELGMLIRAAAEQRQLRKQLGTTKRELALLTSIYEASSAIISTLDPDQALQTVVEQARRAVSAWRASIVLIDEAGRPRHLTATGFEKDRSAFIRPAGVSMQVMKTNKPYVVENVIAQHEQVHPGMVEDGVGAAVCLPLTLREKAIGVMWIHYGEPRSFLEAEIEALRIYANQAAIAYDNARRMRELEHMRRAAEAMAGATELRDVLQQIVRSAREVLGADSSAIWSYDAIRGRFFPEELVADSIPGDLLQRFRPDEPQPGRTAYTVMKCGWVGVPDIADPQYDFLGASSRELLRAIGVKAFQGIALKVGDESLGVLYVNYNRHHIFTAEDRSALETFANHAALALKKARLLDQLAKARGTAQVVAEITALGDLQSTLDAIARGTQDALGCDVVTLYTYDQDRDQFVFPPTMVGVREPEEVLRVGRVARESVVGNVLALDRYHLSENAPSDPLIGGTFVSREGIKSSVAIPLRVRDRKVGVMFVNYRTPHRFTANELTDIELFANQAAVAIRNAQLYEQMQERADTLQALYEAGKAITGTLDLDEILNCIVEQAWRLAGRYGKQQAQFSHLALVDGNKLRLTAAYPQEMWPQLKQVVGEIDLECGERMGITGRVVKTGQSNLVGDVTQDPDYIKYGPEIRSELAVPIKIGEQIIGVINVEHPEYNAFDAADQQALEALAAQAASVIRNARQYEELKRTKGLVGARTAVAWMGMVSAAWRHAIAGNAQAIRDWVSVTRLDLERGVPAGKLQDRLDDIENMARKILETPITAPLSAEEGVKSVPLNDLVRERFRQLWEKEPYKSVQLRLDFALDDAATTRASREWLRRMLDVLVDNAVEAMVESPVKQLTVATRLADGGAEIAITDTGGGIPEDVLPKLFQEPIQKPKGAKGLGVGLLLAQTIVQTYGGEIRVASTGPAGTTMVIWLPIEQ